jgi:COP9 signalosome complex subunit 3
MAPNDPSQSLDGILNQITTTNNYAMLNHTLRNSMHKDIRDTILASPLASGQDPLSVLDLRTNTLGVLYIMFVLHIGQCDPDLIDRRSARLNTSTSAPPSMQVIQDFCRYFTPEQARYAPDRGMQPL